MREPPGPVEQETAVVLVIHGNYGEAMVAAAEAMVGGLNLPVVEIDCQSNPPQRHQQIRERVEQHTQGRQDLLLLTDLYGSTPANVCIALIQQHPRWEMISGVSLPMLMKLSTCDRGLPANRLAHELRETAVRCCRLGREMIPEEEMRGDPA